MSRFCPTNWFTTLTTENFYFLKQISDDFELYLNNDEYANGLRYTETNFVA